MTKEEREKAISALKMSTPIMALTPNEFDDYIKTLNNLMDWLEQEPCEDCISREAVIDINHNHYGEMPNHINHQIWEEINALPSIQPTAKENLVVGNCISRAEAQKHIYQRLWESALNNVGYECKAEDVFMDIADNRLRTWVSEIPSIQPKSKTDVLDKIIAEIKTKYDSIPQYCNYDYGWIDALEWIASVIDKYKAESEDKE